MNTKRELTRMQYEVIDNYLPQEQFQSIKDILMGSVFPWFYKPDVTSFKNEITDTMYFVHMFYHDHAPSSAFMGNIFPLIEKLNPKALLRIKGNLYPNIGKRIKDLDHVDYEFEHKGAIFYINTNNGPTVLEDGTEIEAVENRILLFKPHKMHNSFHCTDQKVRVNININYF